MSRKTESGRLPTPGGAGGNRTAPGQVSTAVFLTLRSRGNRGELQGSCARTFSSGRRGTLRTSLRFHILTSLASGGIPPGQMNSRGGPPRLRLQLPLPYKAGPGGAGGVAVAAPAPPGPGQLLGPATQSSATQPQQCRGTLTAGHGQIR